MTTSIGATAPSSTLLGSTAVGGSLATGATRVDRGRPNGTLLTGPGSTDPKTPRTPRLPPKYQPDV